MSLDEVGRKLDRLGVLGVTLGVVYTLGMLAWLAR